jgi:hypothetical protein
MVYGQRLIGHKLGLAGRILGRAGPEHVQAQGWPRGLARLLTGSGS